MSISYPRILWGILWSTLFVGTAGCGGEREFGRPQAEDAGTVDSTANPLADAADDPREDDATDPGTDTTVETDSIEVDDVRAEDVGVADVLEEVDVTDELDPADTGVPETEYGVTTTYESMGAERQPDDSICFRVLSQNATRVEAWLYEAPGQPEIARIDLLNLDGPLREGCTDGASSARFYGLRAWGPNWPYDPEWTPGTEIGLDVETDNAGNRFNPNKLIVDPWAREITHDPYRPSWDDVRIYLSGPEFRDMDSAAIAPLGVILDPLPDDPRPEVPTRQLADDIIYEVHVRGLTMSDTTVPEALRGTYAGAALKAPYLAALGVTAVEFLPLHETQNDRNDQDISTAGDNYWGYASLSFFAPDRRYAADQSPGGPTRELRAMVDAFHSEGIKVFVDVVYNHTGEGGVGTPPGPLAQYFSWRGLDNQAFYQTVNRYSYRNDNGVGPNVNFRSPITRQMVVDSLRYWHEELGVDGFRFDLAAILGNDCAGDCFRFDPTGFPAELAELFSRDTVGNGVDLIAEPWGASDGTYNAGNFPPGWHEWNDRYRIAMRSAINRTPDVPTARDLAGRIFGSFDVFGDDGRGPDASVGYLVSHDGFTWNDLFSCSDKLNDQAWPWGPSDGGSDFNQGNNYEGVRADQLQAARTAMAVVMASAGVPILTGGDEFLRSQVCNNNAYNVDSVANWLDWSGVEREAKHLLFVTRMLSLRRMHEALRPQGWFGAGADRDDDGLPTITWYDINAGTPSEDYWANPLSPVMVWRVDTDEPVDGRSPVNESNSRSIAWLWNRSDEMQSVQLPPVADDTAWFRVADTAAWLRPESNSHPLDDLPRMTDRRYGVHPQSIVVLMEQQVEVP
jgi:glycogen operon protein